MEALAVATGGALGALARWGASVGANRLVDGAFPLGTFLVNLIGSFAIGVAFVWVETTGASLNARYFLTVGLLGSFTTFSTFSFEALVMVQTGAWLRAAGYLAASVALGVTFVAVGMAVAGRVT